MNLRIRKQILRNAFIAVIAVMVLFLIPLWVEPEGVPIVLLESGQVDEVQRPPQLLSPLVIPDAEAGTNCPRECQITVCVSWIPGPSPECPNPGRGGGCCEQQETSCDDGCDVNPPPPVYSPPTVSGSTTCTLGSNGWCVDAAFLNVSASDPQGFAVTITGTTPDFSCVGSCSTALPVGSGTANYTAKSATSGKTDTGSTAWKYDPADPQATYTIAGGTPAGGWYRNSVTFTASASDAVSGLASLTVKDNGFTVSNPATMGEGVHNVTLTSADNAGNVATSSVTVRVDITPPVISRTLSTSPASSGWHTTTPVLNVSAADAGSGVVSISITDNGVALANGSTLGDGVHNLAITAIDLAGNSSTESFTVRVDATPPVITPDFIGTLGSHGWYVTDVDVIASFTDATSGIASTIVLLDGNVITLPSKIDSDGERTLILNARDNAGNLSSRSYTVKIDQTPPILEVSRTGDVGENGWYRSEVEYQITATDATSIPQYGEYRIDNGVWQTGMTFTVSGDGTHTVDYRAFDNAGNVTAKNETLLIDTTLPEVSFSAPSADTVVDKTVQVSGAALDTGTSGLEAVEVSVDGGASWQPVSVGAWTYAWNVSDLPNGDSMILVRAHDFAGNVSTAARLSLKVDNAGPLIRLADPWRFDEAGELWVAPNGYGVGLVSIQIVDSAGVVMSASEHTAGDLPAIIWWNGKHKHERQPAGEYTVRVTACDVHGVCATARSAIIIPAFYYEFNERPKFPPEVVVTAPPLPVVSAPKPIEETPQSVATTDTMSQVTQYTGGMWFVLAGLGLLVFANSILDPRPRAIHSLANTIQKKIMGVNK